MSLTSQDLKEIQNLITKELSPIKEDLKLIKSDIKDRKEHLSLDAVLANERTVKSKV